MRLATKPRARDYQSELNAVLARGAAAYPEEERYANPFADDNPIFDVSPFEGFDDEAPYGNETRPRDLPDPLEEFMPEDSQVHSIEETDATDVAMDAPRVDLPVDNAAGLSDRAVYSMVVDELTPDERDDFGRAWALMSVDQRADLLDDFRARVEGQN